VALRKAFILQPELQVTAIREVYENELGEMVRQHVELDQKIAAKADQGASEGALAPYRKRQQAQRTCPP
jgi:hypothetical protein